MLHPNLTRDVVAEHFICTGTLYFCQEKQPPFSTLLYLRGISVASQESDIAKHQDCNIGFIKNVFATLSRFILAECEARLQCCTPI